MIPYVIVSYEYVYKYCHPLLLISSSKLPIIETKIWYIMHLNIFYNEVVMDDQNLDEKIT